MIKKMTLSEFICLTVFLLCGWMMFVFGGESVFAYGDQDGGGGNVHGSTSCNGCVCGVHYTTSKCKDGTGGASWHIYEIDNRANTNGGPKYSSGLLSNNGWDYSTSEFKSTCPASQYTHYVAFGWDGWDGRNYNGDSKSAKKNVPTHWGPVHRGTCMEANGKCHKPNYNKNNLHTASEIKERLNAGKSVNGWRITDATALKIYKRWKKNATDISNKVGYFCVHLKAELTATAIDKQGNVLRSKFDTSSYSAVLSSDNKNVVVDRTKYSKEGYVFKGWVLDKANAGDESKYVSRVNRYNDEGNPYLYYRSVNNKKFYVNARKLSDDKERKGKMTVYAVYEPGDGDDECTGDCCPGDAGYPNCPTTTTTDNLCGQWGNVVPGKTTTTSRVRNASVADYADWSGSVYAKPTDKIYWHHCYYPGVQTMAFELATPLGSHKDNLGHAETPSDCNEWSGSCSSLSSYEFTNVMLSSGAFGAWTNRFSIGSGSDHGSYSSTYNGQSRSFPIGDSTGQSFSESNNSNVATKDVGATLNEKITTGTPVSASTNNQGPYSWSCKWNKLGKKVHHYTPTYDCNCTTDEETGEKSCETCGGDPVEWDYYGWTDTCRHNTSFISSEIDKSTTNSQADVLVPYNFENNTEITNDADEVLFAGETFEVKFDINVEPRDNETLGNGVPYATKVDGAKSRLKVCPDGMECSYTNYKSEPSLSNFTSMFDFENGYGIQEYTSIVVPDLPAGRNVCVQAQVYPVDSHDDLNLSQTVYPEGDENSWAQSEFACFVVAKKPTLQAWGGNVFSQNNLNTSIAAKRHLSGESYSPSSGGTSGTRLFGSWGELGVFSNGTITGFASGASLGYGGGSSPAFQSWGGSSLVNPTGIVGGSSTSLNSICSRSRLTFSNADAFSKQCTLNSIGGMRSLSNIAKIENDKSSIINVLAVEPDSNIIEVEDDEIVIDGITTDEPYVIRVYKSVKNITINGDIVYNGMYDSMEKIPKIILYGDNVDISCNVKQIDALIIAEGVVDTCYESDEVNDPLRSNQLRVYGAIITSRLDAKRTYGAGPGANSGIAAEIIDFDPALYSFGGGLTDEENDNVAGRLDVSSIHELAPRK